MGEGEDDKGKMGMLGEENSGRRERARASESEGRVMMLDSPGSRGLEPAWRTTVLCKSCQHLLAHKP